MTGRQSAPGWAGFPRQGKRESKGEGLLQRGILGSPHFPLLGPAPTRGLGSGGGGGGGGGPWSPPASAGGRREVAARHGRPGGLHCPIMGGWRGRQPPVVGWGGAGAGSPPGALPGALPRPGGTGAGALARAPLTAPLAVWPAAPLSLALPLALPLAQALPSTLPFPPNDPVGVRPRWEEGAGGRSRG